MEAVWGFVAIGILIVISGYLAIFGRVEKKRKDQ